MVHPRTRALFALIVLVVLAGERSADSADAIQPSCPSPRQIAATPEGAASCPPTIRPGGTLLHADGGVVSRPFDHERVRDPRTRGYGGATTTTSARGFAVTVGAPQGSVQSDPAISGAFVVWWQRRGGGGVATGDVLSKSLATGRVSPLTTSGAVVTPPAIDGATVVWEECRPCSVARDALGYYTLHGVQLYTKNLTMGRAALVATLADVSPSAPPAISGQSVIWHDRRGGKDTEVVKSLVTGRVFTIDPNPQCAGQRQARSSAAGFVVRIGASGGRPHLCGIDLSTGHTFPIPVGGAGLRSPRDAKNSGRFVVWTDWDSNRANQPASIYVADVATGREVRVVTIPYGRFNPRLGPATAVGGPIVVWQAAPNAPYTGTNADLYGYDLATGRTLRITDDPYEQRSPAISGATAVWQEIRGGTTSIRGATIATT